MTESITLHLPYFRGFIFKYANTISIQPQSGRDLIYVQLNNVVDVINERESEQDEWRKHAGTIVKFSQKIFQFITERKVSRFTVRFWRMPTEMAKKSDFSMTRAQLRSQTHQDQIIDKPIAPYEKYLGVIYLHLKDGTMIDIRKIGIEEHCLKLIENPSWAIEGFQPDLENVNRIASIRKITPRIPVYNDLRPRRNLNNSSIMAHKFSKIWIEVTVPQDKVGLVAGRAFATKISLEEDYAVRIDIPKAAPENPTAIIKITGDSETNITEAARAMEELVCQSCSSNQLLGGISTTSASTIFNISNPKRNNIPFTMCELFKSNRGKLVDVTVIGAKSIISYTVATILPEGWSVIFDVDLMGLQTITTRGNTESWVNSADTQDLVNELQLYSGTMVGSRFKMSMEAMGYAKGNTSHNIHAILFFADTKGNTVNEDIVRKGLCKILQSSRYYNPYRRSRESPIRSFYPYYRNLVMESKPEECNGLSWCKTERMILEAERKAASEGLGIWKKYEGLGSPSPFIPRDPTSTGRHFLFIDNSNIWITAKNFSGEHKGKGFDAMKRFSLKLALNGSQYTEDEIILGHRNNAKIENFISDRRAYNKSDNGWRLDFQKLLALVSYDRKKDPTFLVAGSVPPANESIWSYMNDLGSYNLITSRTTEGSASSEDTSLVTSISKAIYNDMVSGDKLILCAGDRGFRYELLTAREKFPDMKIYVISWAHAAYHRLKHMDDPHTFFINLDPYVDYLRYSVDEHEQLNADLTECEAEDRLVIYPSSDHFKDDVRRFLQGEGLVEDRHFCFRSIKSSNEVCKLYVVFTSVQRDTGNIRLLVEAIPVLSSEEFLERYPVISIRSQRASRVSFNIFNALSELSDEEEDNQDEDFFKNFDENDAIVDDENEYL